MKNLTPMQAAYWTGRQAKGFLGNVSAHLYVEFDCGPIEVKIDKILIPGSYGNQGLVSATLRGETLVELG